MNEYLRPIGLLSFSRLAGELAYGCLVGLGRGGRHGRDSEQGKEATEKQPANEYIAVFHQIA